MLTGLLLTAALASTSASDVDRSCSLASGRLLADEDETTTRYAVIETHPAPARTIVVCDLAAGTVLRVFRVRDNPDDLVLPLVLPAAIAQTIRDHQNPPPPPTAEEKLILAYLDEPPLDPSERAAEACLYDENACPHPHGHPPVLRGDACSVAEGTTPLALLLLLGAAPRRRRGGVP